MINHAITIAVIAALAVGPQLGFAQEGPMEQTSPSEAQAPREMDSPVGEQGEDSKVRLEYSGETDTGSATADNKDKDIAPSAEKVVDDVESGEIDERIVVKETDDTVYVVKRSQVEEMAGEFRKRMKHMREKGYGLSGGFGFGISAINTEAIRKVTRTISPLRGRDFEFTRYNYEPFPMRGGMGYAGVGNGVRLGISGMSGSRDFSGKRFETDTLALPLRIDVGYGGFLLEKAITREKIDFIFGGILGGGHTTLEFSDPVNVEEWFGNLWDDDDRGELKARFGLLQLHGGFTYSITQYVHVGGDLWAPVFLSLEGFSPYTGDFYTVNPGIKIRVVFGNLG